MKHKLALCLTFALCFCYAPKINAIYNDSNVKSYEEELINFPCDYKTKIEELHKIYPNATFVAQNKFFSYETFKEIPVLWSEMLKAQLGKDKSHIYYTASANYKTSECTQGGTWCTASEAGVSYYLNPYNFLNEKNVFMFESLYSKNYHTKEGVEKVLAGSFMANKECPGAEGKKYSEVLIEAGQKNNVSPYMLASRLIQEQGVKGKSSLISGTYSGYEGYYNYFNISASGKTDTEVIVNGLKKAKSEKWTSPYISIVAGAKFVYKQYIGINDTYNVIGQSTLYLQKWDPYGPWLANHQYMQNIQAPVSEASTTFKSYSSFSDYKNYAYVFYIPIYEGAPNTTNTSCGDPTTTPPTDTGSIKIKSYKVSGSYITGFSLGESIDNVVNKLKADNPNSKVAYSKNKNNQSSSVATADTITIQLNSEKKTYQVVIYGDVNGDGKIYATDYVNIKNHIKGTNKLSGAYAVAADVDRNGNIYATDYVKVKNHIKGINLIKQ